MSERKMWWQQKRTGMDVRRKDERVRDSKSVGQRETDWYRDSWMEEIRRTRGSYCPLFPNTSLTTLEKRAVFYPLPSAYQWVSINHRESNVCLSESAQHQYGWPPQCSRHTKHRKTEGTRTTSARLTTTMQPAYKTQKDRGDKHRHTRTHTHKHRGKHKSPKQSPLLLRAIAFLSFHAHAAN